MTPLTPQPIRVPGFRASGVSCGIKESGRDLALIASERPAALAGVFTRSTVVGAAVTLCRQRASAGRARGIVVNSGVSNVAMGARGLRDAEEMARCAARTLRVPPEEVLMASTGVIGEPLPMARIRRGVRAAGAALSPDGLRDAAEAIMTTDTFAKTASATARVDGHTVTVAGIAKGSGMVEPNMATMLAFLLTDAAAEPAFLRRALRETAGESFNRLTIDGETSTSDTVLLLAGGAAGNRPLRDARSPGVAAFRAALQDVAVSLTRDLARDGEGATRLVTVRVGGAATPADAERAVRRIANSLLVKTALFGGDANWGRILQTVGAARVKLDLERAVVRLAGVVVFQGGASTGPAARRKAAETLREASPDAELEVAIDLGAGRHGAHLWTCDISYDYVKINAEYTT